MPTPNVILKIPSTVAHLSQIVTGFHLLHQQGLINLEFHDYRHRLSEFPNYMVLEAEIDGKRIAFDVEDGYTPDVGSYEKYLREG